MRTRTAALLFLLLVPLGARADEGVEFPGVGVLFLTPKDGKPPAIYEKPESGSKVLRNGPPNARLVFKSHLEINGKATWYLVQPPLGAPGWVKAQDISLTRPGVVPDARPMRLVEDGKTAGTSSTVTTAAARGLDGRARSYAASSEELKLATSQFITLEERVLAHFSDPAVFVDKLDANGNYDDVPNPVRDRKAHEFKDGAK